MATPTRLLLLVSAVLCSAATGSGQVTDCLDVDTLTDCVSNFTSTIDTALTQTVSDFRAQICEVEEIRVAAWCVIFIINDCPTLAEAFDLLTTDFSTVVGLIEQEYSSMDEVCSSLCGSHQDCISQLGPNTICTDNMCGCGSGFYPNPEGGGCILDTTTDDDIVCPSTGCSSENVDLQRASNGCRGFCQCSPAAIDDTNTASYYWQRKACAQGTTFDTSIGLCNSGSTCTVVDQVCKTDEECQNQLSDTVCRDEACVCSSGSLDDSGVCSTDDCLSDAQIELGNIPKRLKRMSSTCSSLDNATSWWLLECVYESDVDTSLSDHDIQEAWYRIPNYRLSEQTDSVSIGDCGTYYPIYLKEPLPVSLVDGGEVDVPVTVIGLDKYGDYDYSIKARMCGGTIQYLLAPPPVRFAAYCLEFVRQCTTVEDCGLDVHMDCIDEICMCANGYDAFNNLCTDLGLSCSPNGTCEVKNTECAADNTCNCLDDFVPIDGQCIYDATATAPYYATVEVKLNYYTDEVENMYKPYVEFVCNPRYSNEPPVYSYLISWYADGTHLQTSDVLTAGSEDLKPFTLTEMELIEAGYSMGVKVRCGVQTADTDLRLWSTEILSYEITTGVNTGSMYLQHGDNTTLFRPYSNVPFGCSSIIGAAEANTCELTIMVADSIAGSVCSPQGPTGDRSPHCVMRLPGVTKDEWDASGGDWEQWNFYDYEYDTQIGTSTQSGLLIRTDSDDDYDANNFVLALMTENQDHHTFWNDYRLPYAKVYVADNSGDMGQRYDTISMEIGERDNGTALTIMDYRNGFRETVWLVEEGEYIVYRSSDVPYQLHVTIDGSLRMCGMTLRLRNSIYSLDYVCEGVYLAGVIHGPAEYEFYDWGGQWSMMDIDQGWYEVWRDLHFSYNYISVPTKYGNIEGIASIFDTSSEETHQHRNGVRSGDVAAFVRSWKARPGESLLDPQNHVDVTLAEEKWTCGCPRQTVFTTNESWSYEVKHSDTYRNIYNYNGEVMCSLNDGHRCTKTTPPDTAEWPPSLIPEYNIKYIAVFPELLNDPGNPPMLTFSCNFSAVDGYLYIVTWLSGDFTVSETSFVSSTEALESRLNADQLFATVNGYTLDSPIQCAVSVYSASGEQLLPNSYSAKFFPIKVQSTSITIGRVGDSSISFKVNIPFDCLPTSGETSCELMIKLYDPDDGYDCRDSTIAFRSQITCGFNVPGITTVVDGNNIGTDGYSVTVAITTKNNNIKYKLRKAFQLRIRTAVRGWASSFWTNELATTINVTVHEETTWQRKTCHANNDVRHRTSDGIYFYTYSVDEYVMYRHKLLPLEVQIKTVSCNGGWASCVCAATVRQGRDIYTMNYCGRIPVTGYIASSPENKLDVFDKSCTRKKIVFRHGTVVELFVSPWRSVVNVYISLSPGDVGNIWGLCGSFNGRTDDDFTHRDGTIEPVSAYWWWRSPDDFVKSWGLGYNNLLETESLLNKSNAETDLWKNVTELPLCVCPNEGQDEPLCSINEDHTCTVPVDRGGNILDKNAREARSARTLNLDMERRLEQGQDGWSYSHVVRREAEENPNAISEADAFILCQQYYTENCPTYQYDDDALFSSTNDTLGECAQDVALDPGAGWQDLSMEAYVTQVSIELDRDTEYQETHVAVTTAIRDKACPNNCYGHGSCNNGKCLCDEGYGTDECILDVGEGVNITETTGGGVCDISTYGECSCILLVGSGFVRDCLCTIEVTHYYYDRGDRTLRQEVIMHAGLATIYHSLNEVFCCLDEEDGRRRRAAEVEVGQQYGLTASNDGTNYGDPVYVFVLDSTCMEITDSNGTQVVLLKTAYCYIDGICVVEGASDSVTNCLVCRYSTDLFDWTPENCTTTAAPTDAAPTDAAPTDADPTNADPTNESPTTAASSEPADDNTAVIAAATCGVAALLLLTVATVVVYKFCKRPQNVAPIVMPVIPANVHYTMPLSAWMDYTPDKEVKVMPASKKFQSVA